METKMLGRRAAVLALLVAGAAPVSAAPVIVASIFPLAAIAREVAPQARVISLLTPGANPHSFEPTPSQVWAAARADVVVRIGLGFDDWVLRIVEGVRNPPRTVIASEGIELLPLDVHMHAADAHHEGEEVWDPHIWMDPLIAASIARRIAESLAETDEAKATTYGSGAERFAAAMHDLDRELRAMLAPHAAAGFVGTHAAWGYFARRYGLRQVAVLERAPGRPAGPRYLLQVAAAARQTAARAVFAEVQLSQGEAHIIGEEASLPVVLLDPLGGSDVEGRSTYAALLRWNVRRIVAALGREPR